MNRSESKYFNTAVRMDKAMIEILEKKDFEYITIKEICDKAEVNRSTFYLHYSNTVDLLEETGRYLENEFLSYFSSSKSKLIEEQTLDKIHLCNPSELNFLSPEYLHPFLTFFQDNKRVLLTVLSRSNTFKLERSFEMMFEHFFNPILTRFNYPEKQRKYVMLFYLSGIIAIVTEWLNGGCIESVQEISEIIKISVHGMNQDFESRIKERTE